MPSLGPLSQLNMIILDIETGGLDPQKNALLSIGAVDYNTGDEFYIEAYHSTIFAHRIDDAALAVNGFTREQIAQWDDKTRPIVEVAYVRFLKWCEGRDLLIGGQQVGAFDLRFLKEIHTSIESINHAFDAKGDGCMDGDIHREAAHIKKWPFGHRSADLHSVAYAKLGKSLSLDGILQAVGLAPEPKPHNALTGARLERDAFKLLLS